MSRRGTIAFEWAGERRLFRLPISSLVELQEATDSGPYLLFNRLDGGNWRVSDISNVIMFGLIGGGVSPPLASALVSRHVERRPPLENLISAQVILSAGIVGALDEPTTEKRRKPSNNPPADLPNGKIRFSSFYGLGAVMGFSPEAVGELSLWQFAAAVEGYVEANSQDDGALSTQEIDELWAWVQE